MTHLRWNLYSSLMYSGDRHPRRATLAAASTWTIVVALGAVALSGCRQSDSVSLADSLLARDLTLATASAPAPVSALGDTAARVPSVEPTRPAATPAPRVSPQRSPRPTSSTASRSAAATPAPTGTPAPAPAVTEPPVIVAPTPATATVPSVDAIGDGKAAGRRALGEGTVLVGRTNSGICSLANRPGDRIVATLGRTIEGPDGARLPAGTPILVEMATPSAGGDFAFRVRAVQVNGVLIPVEGTVVATGETTSRRVSKGGDQGKVVTGAIAGAILGRILGGGTKGAVIGAAGGAAAGTVAAARNSESERCLPEGATLTVTLTAPLVLTPGVP